MTDIILHYTWKARMPRHPLPRLPLNHLAKDLPREFNPVFNPRKSTKMYLKMAGGANVVVHESGTLTMNKTRISDAKEVARIFAHVAANIARIARIEIVEGEEGETSLSHVTMYAKVGFRVDIPGLRGEWANAERVDEMFIKHISDLDGITMDKMLVYSSGAVQITGSSRDDVLDRFERLYAMMSKHVMVLPSA